MADAPGRTLLRRVVLAQLAHEVDLRAVAMRHRHRDEVTFRVGEFDDARVRERRDGQLGDLLERGLVVE